MVLFYEQQRTLVMCAGPRNSDVKYLALRVWTCKGCGSLHDRDHNASQNIKHEGIRLLIV
ncbi:transposase [Paenibacillus frigoriresistens]|uniref:zinc ribbon domain-containing protein n=1 Tax=Paenibacillus alginolyticus TaxID=59839 RepID=UPI0015632F52|nr:zinc ribbon domain-containing protein [Paenibacillus frigoriresistens]NRF92512.1 transposase [Paenibacillus frigoriresistens]